MHICSFPVFRFFDLYLVVTIKKKNETKTEQENKNLSKLAAKQIQHPKIPKSDIHLSRYVFEF